MKIEANSVDEYLNNIPEERKPIMNSLRQTVLTNIPENFSEELNYGMIGYVVPLSFYPDGYHCDPKLPLPFINIASQKNHIGFYHMGIYASPSLMQWFIEEFPKYSSRKLDMGKSCIRFKKPEHIPLELLGRLVSKMTAQEWIELYEQNLRR